MIGRWCAAAAAVIGVVVAASPAASADPEFYQPPPALPGQAGGTDPDGAAAVGVAAGQRPRRATRIMYRSNDTHDSANAVTGFFFDPAVPWTGPGPRPLVSMAAGTQGQGDKCAPSRTIGTVLQFTPPSDVIVSYEAVFVGALLSRGIAVVLTDLDGLGTPGTHVRQPGGVGARRARRRPRRETPARHRDHPGRTVAFWGYSQGGGASAAAVGTRTRVRARARRARCLRRRPARRSRGDTRPDRRSVAVGGRRIHPQRYGCGRRTTSRSRSRWRPGPRRPRFWFACQTTLETGIALGHHPEVRITPRPRRGRATSRSYREPPRSHSQV
ncbi:hypothetical protein GS462_26100 [Rhodococcus hoagii]|nr:hypothetical protein [Prescottella equi]